MNLPLHMTSLLYSTILKLKTNFFTNSITLSCIGEHLANSLPCWEKFIHSQILLGIFWYTFSLCSHTSHLDIALKLNV